MIEAYYWGYMEEGQLLLGQWIGLHVPPTDLGITHYVVG